MGIRGLNALVFSLGAALIATDASAQTVQRLPGTPRVDRVWGSGYLDLSPSLTFAANERLRIAVGGTASRVVVRLLPKGESPDQPVGVIREAVQVPQSRVIEIPLGRAYPNIAQVSVHGMAKPWNRYDLGSGNGPATLLWVARVR